MSEVARLFGVHKLNPTGLRRAEVLAEQFTMLFNCVEAMNPQPSRELSLAKTHLEIACFYAKKSIALQPENQEVVPFPRSFSEDIP